MHIFGRGIALGAFLLALSGNAGAVATRTFELSSLEELSGGSLDGVAIGANGIVRPGWTLHSEEFPEAVTAVTASLRLADGTTLLGTSPGGRIFRVDGAKITTFADTKEIAVTALAQSKSGGIFAATTSGRIYRVTSGKAEIFVELPDTALVSALIADRTHDGLYAAGGSPATVFRIEPGGAASTYYRSDEPFLVSLAMGDGGEVYAGSQGKALLYKIAGPGRASVLYDFPGDDVRSIVVGPHGTLFAIANEYVDASDNPGSHKPPTGHVTSGPATLPKIKPGKGALYRFDESGRPERLMHHDDMHYTALALDATGSPYVGTGAEGRVYTVDDAHVATLVVDTDARQVTALDLSREHPLIATSDTALVQLIQSRPVGEALWTSKPLDAGIRAHFGHLRWRASGSLTVSARTGNTSVPDATWSDWSAQILDGAPIPAPPGRFLQLRARWGGDVTATLSQMSASFVTDNLRAVVTEISVRNKSNVLDTKEGIAASGGEVPKHESVTRISWKVDNPDSDSLRYYVQFAREGDTVWRDVVRPEDIVTKQEVDWDTQTIPEGRYHVRVTATDELSNPASTALSHSLESAYVTVDNTPPVVTQMDLSGRRLLAKASDGASAIARAEFSVDGRNDWRPLDCAGGIFDALSESIEGDLGPLLKPGPHVVALRVYDAAGNFSVREILTK